MSLKGKKLGNMILHRVEIQVNQRILNKGKDVYYEDTREESS